MSGISEENRQPDSNKNQDRIRGVIDNAIYDGSLSPQEYADLVIVVRSLVVSVQRETREADAKIADTRRQEFEDFAKTPESDDPAEVEDALAAAAICRGIAYSIRSQGTDHD